MLHRSRVLVILAVLVVAAAATQAADGASSARTRTVVLRNIQFQPRKLVISRGDSITWLWRDGSIPHNVVSNRFHMSPVKSHGSYTVRFSRSGSYPYVCTIHPGMTGTIVVR